MELGANTQNHAAIDQNKTFRLIGMELLLKATVTAASIGLLAGMAALLLRAS